MFCALAESKLTGPCTLLIVVLLLTSWLELEEFLVHARLATVLVFELSFSDVLCVAESFFDELELLVLALVSVSDDWCALVAASTSVLAWFEVELLAAAEPSVDRLFAAVSFEAEVFPALDVLLVDVELPTLLDLPPVADEAEFDVAAEVDVSFPLKVWFDEWLSVSESFFVEAELFVDALVTTLVAVSASVWLAE